MTLTLNLPDEPAARRWTEAELRQELACAMHARSRLEQDGRGGDGRGGLHCYDSGNWIGDSCHGWAMDSNRSKYRPAELPPISRTLGKTSRSKREHAGLNREDFAKLAGLSTSGLRRVEDMETMPSVLTLEKICAGFGISLMELIAATDRRSRA